MPQWRVETLGPAVDAELEALPPALRARLLRLMEMVEKVGLDHMREPHVKHVEGKLWELRAKAPGGIARGLYVAATGRRVVVLHVFAKKSAKSGRRPRICALTAEGYSRNDPNSTSRQMDRGPRSAPSPKRRSRTRAIEELIRAPANDAKAFPAELPGASHAPSQSRGSKAVASPFHRHTQR